MPGSGFDYLQYASTVLGLFYLVYSIRWMIDPVNRDVWRKEIPLFIVVFCIVIFYIALFVDRFDTIWSVDFFTNWSAILRFLTIVIALSMLIFRRKFNGSKGG